MKKILGWVMKFLTQGKIKYLFCICIAFQLFNVTLSANWTERSIIVGTTTTQIAPQSSSRSELIIYNNGNNDLYVSYKDTIDINQSLRVKGNGGSCIFIAAEMQVSGVTETGATDVVVWSKN